VDSSCRSSAQIKENRSRNPFPNRNTDQGKPIKESISKQE
jgi:hypothetical protein